jgi:hypothetical protein
MICKEVRELLSSYVDGQVDADTSREVKKHIDRCSLCAEELARLERYTRVLGGLEEVPAPKDFLVRLHGKLEREKRRTPLIARLLRPSGFTIPLELAGAAAVVVLALLLFDVMHFPGSVPPAKESGAILARRGGEGSPADSGPAAGGAGLEIASRSAGAPAAEKEGEAAAEVGESAVREEHPLEGAAGEERVAGEITREEPSIESTAALEEARGAFTGKSLAKMKKAEPTESETHIATAGETEGEAAEGRITEDVTADEIPADKETAAGARDEVSREEIAEAPEEKSTRGEKQEEYELALVVPEKTAKADFEIREEYASRVSRLLESLGGSIVYKEYRKSDNRPSSITAVIPGRHLEELIEKLREMGEVEYTPPPDVADRRVQLKIKFVPPR